MADAQGAWHRPGFDQPLPARSRLHRWPGSWPEGSYRRMASKPRHRINAEATAAYAATARDGFGSRIRDRHRRPQRRQRARPSVVTTMTDPTIPQKEISRPLLDALELRIGHSSDQAFPAHGRVCGAKSPSMVRKEIWCHLLAYNLLRGTMVEAAKRNDMLPRQLSVKGTMQAVESFTPGHDGHRRQRSGLRCVADNRSAHRVGNRPGRQEPRFKKRRPAWKVYMTETAQRIPSATASGRTP